MYLEEQVKGAPRVRKTGKSRQKRQDRRGKTEEARQVSTKGLQFHDSNSILFSIDLCLNKRLWVNDKSKTT